MISSLKQMTMDAKLCRIFTQYKLHVRTADKSVMLPNNKDQPFHQQLRHFCPLLSIYPTFLFVLYSSFRNILPLFPSFAPSVYFYLYFLFLLFPFLPLHFFFEHDLFLLSSPFIFYWFVCILFFHSTSLCLFVFVYG